ncbi:hypothetical protein VTI74DRAFT_4527 [Chaetomium olivicolor]
MMTRSKFPGELSFGIELEFMFYFKVPTLQQKGHHLNQLQISPEEEKCLPPALTLPGGLVHDPDSEICYGEIPENTSRAWAKGLIEEAILSIPGAKLEDQPMPAGTPEKYRSMYITSDPTDDHSGWTVKNDSSVRDSMIDIYGYAGASFEITSPALWDRPESHRHVYEVVRELTMRFRLRLNLRTGFHCHVGAGLELGPREHTPNLTTHPDDDDAQNHSETEIPGKKHSLSVLKRAAVLMWAADGFLCHAHPPERSLNVYAPPLRLCSRLAHGKEIRYFGDNGEATIAEETPLPTGIPPFRFPPNLLRERDLPSYSFPRLSPRLFPAVRPREPNPQARHRFDHLSDMMAITYTGGPPPQTTVAHGLRHILCCRNRAQLAQLLAPPNDQSFYNRLNYNLRNYLPPRFRAARDTGTYTVEFREATGSLAPEWVSAWTSICLGVFRFARDASEARFWAVVKQLADAEEDAVAEAEKGRVRGTTPAQSYDMISLLFDMGLFAEGLYLEKKLRGNAVRFWYPNLLPRQFARNSEDERGDAGQGDGPWPIFVVAGGRRETRSRLGPGKWDQKGKGMVSPTQETVLSSAMSSPFVRSPDKVSVLDAWLADPQKPGGLVSALVTDAQCHSSASLRLRKAKSMSSINIYDGDEE